MLLPQLWHAKTDYTHIHRHTDVDIRKHLMLSDDFSWMKRLYCCRGCCCYCHYGCGKRLIKLHSCIWWAAAKQKPKWDALKNSAEYPQRYKMCVCTYVAICKCVRALDVSFFLKKSHACVVVVHTLETWQKCHCQPLQHQFLRVN